MKCKKCGAEIIDGAKFCGVCGNPIEYNYDICKYCGAKLPKGAVFCAECGKKLTEDDSAHESSTQDLPIKETISESQTVTFNEEKVNDVSSEKSASPESTTNSPPITTNKAKTKKKTVLIIIGACVVVLAVVGGFLFAHNSHEDEYIGDSDTEYDTESYDENYDDIDEQEEGFEEEAESDVNLMISDSGYSVFKSEYSDEYKVSYGIEIKNKSSKETEKRFITIKATARDKSGSVIDTDEEYFTIEVLPQKTTCVGRTAMYLEEKPEKVEFELTYESDPIFIEKVETVEVSKINMKEKDGVINISGDLINNTKTNYSDGSVFIIYKGKNGIMGGTMLYVEPAKVGKNSFSDEIDPEEKISDKYDVYAMASN